MAGLTSYAQNFEDVILWRALGHVRNGRYIDIGAQSPTVDSVSLGFYERGWRGIHVEPTSAYSSELRSARPDESVIEAAVVAQAGELVFFEVPDTGLSTTRREIADSHVAAGFTMVERVVPAVTLDEVLGAAQGQVIHWLKIDVEGAETDVLRGWRVAQDRPWVLVIESTLPMTQAQSHEEWESLVLAKGYRFVYFDGLNRFYIAEGHDELLPAFTTGPNVFDGFVLSGTASAPFCAGLNSRLQAQGAQLLTERGEAARVLDSLRKEADDRLAALTSELQEYRVQLRDRHAEVQALRDDQLAQRDAQLAQRNAEIALRGALRDAQIALRDAQIVQRDAQIAQRDAQIAQREAQIAERDAHLAQVDSFQKQVQWLQNEWDATKAKVSELSIAAYHWRNESERLDTALGGVLASSSWRVTAPLRAARRILTATTKLPPRMLRGTMSISKKAVKSSLAKVMRGILANPRSTMAVLRLLDRQPKVKARFRMFAAGAGVIDAPLHALDCAPPVNAIAQTADIDLSPQTARVFSDLSLAIQKARR